MNGPGGIGGAVLPVAMVLLLLMGVVAMSTQRSALVQLRMASALHEALQVDLAVESATREAEGMVWRHTIGRAVRHGCFDNPAGCSARRAGSAFNVVDLGEVDGRPGWHRFRITARGERADKRIERVLETVILAGATPTQWQRESWQVLGDE